MSNYWHVKVSHPGLHKFRIVRGSSKELVEQMAAAQLAAWEEMWQRKQNAEAARMLRDQRVYDRDSKKGLAIKKTMEAEENIHTLRQTLANRKAKPFDWNSLKSTHTFEKPRPSPPTPQSIPPKPNPLALKYRPRLDLIEMLIPSLKRRRKQEAADLLLRDCATWKNAAEAIEKNNAQAQADFAVQSAKWKEEEAAFLEEREMTNHKVDERRSTYLKAEPDSITDLCQLVLSNSTYPDSFPQDFDIEYNPESKSLIVDYAMPSFDDLPRIKEVKYIQARDEFKEVCLSDAEFNRLYDDVLYQIALRVTHELYIADEANALSTLVFNGWVTSVDKAIGKEVTACILSLQTDKQEFSQLNLTNVEPKTCFKSLKGVASPRLHSMAPVAPIMRINRQDKRFIDSYEVAASMNEGTNLAAMDWEDFEHLVRELFEKEFATEGAEVKVTRASRDWGVDAVVFDPDPIRGGKIIIQAKRYTNTVDVSSVRDLYGTVINEGAAKGILVTTADYGAEAHEFARGKPLTLLNGNNLLHLLAKHGHKAKIDLKEARALLKETK
jgi:restriction system protein